MIDSNTIKQLALIVNDYSNNHIESSIAKKKTNSIFHNKSVTTIFRELNAYHESFKTEKNVSTIIVIIALYIRNLDAQEIIKNEIIGCDNLMEFYRIKKIELIKELDRIQKIEVAE